MNTANTAQGLWSHSCSVCGYAWEDSRPSHPDADDLCGCCSWGGKGPHLRWVFPGVFEVMNWDERLGFTGTWEECREWIEAAGVEGDLRAVTAQSSC